MFWKKEEGPFKEEVERIKREMELRPRRRLPMLLQQLRELQHPQETPPPPDIEEPIFQEKRTIGRHCRISRGTLP